MIELNDILHTRITCCLSRFHYNRSSSWVLFLPLPLPGPSPFDTHRVAPCRGSSVVSIETWKPFTAWNEDCISLLAPNTQINPSLTIYLKVIAGQSIICSERRTYLTSSHGRPKFFYVCIFAINIFNTWWYRKWYRLKVPPNTVQYYHFMLQFLTTKTHNVNVSVNKDRTTNLE